MIRLIPLFLCLGCSSLLGSRNATSECREYDDSYLAWHAVGIAAGGMAGATGASGVLSATLADEPGADIGLAASSAVFGVLATVAGVLAGEYADRFGERCVDVPLSDGSGGP